MSQTLLYRLARSGPNRIAFSAALRATVAVAVPFIALRLLGQPAGATFAAIAGLEDNHLPEPAGPDDGQAELAAGNLALSQIAGDVQELRRDLVDGQRAR